MFACGSNGSDIASFIMATLGLLERLALVAALHPCTPVTLRQALAVADKFDTNCRLFSFSTLYCH